MPTSESAMSQMSFQIKRGLAEFGYTDHYAVLGLEVDASASEIRKRYVKLARLLHPDSCPSTINKEQASQVLSKLVNPAYQFLAQDKERTDYSLLLKLVGQRANLEYDPARFQSSIAKEVLTHAQYKDFYQSSVNELAQIQYDHIDRAIELIEQISELNLAFLLRQEASQASVPGKSSFPGASQGVPAQPISPEASVTTNAKEPTDKKSSASSDVAQPYIRRAEDLIAKNLFTGAMKELREALRYDPKNTRCHSLLGVVYLKQNQPKMARIYLTKALEFDPQNREALDNMPLLKKLEAQAAKTAPVNAKTTQTGMKPEDRRGLFGLFGGKK